MCIQMWREEEKRPFWLFIINSLWYWFTATTEGLSEGKWDTEMRQYLWESSLFSLLYLFPTSVWTTPVKYPNSLCQLNPTQKACNLPKWQMTSRFKVPSHPSKVLQGITQGSRASELGSALRELKVVELSGTEGELISSRQTTHSYRSPPSLSQWHHSNGCIPLWNIRDDSRWVNQLPVFGSPKFYLSTSTYKNAG